MASTLNLRAGAGLRTLTTIALAVWLVLLADCARAQSKAAPQTLLQSVRIFDALVSFPPASWYTGGDPADSSTFSGGQLGASYAIRQIPKGDFLEAWTRLYSISGVKLAPGHGQTLDSAAIASTDSFQRICSPKRLFAKLIDRDQNSYTTLFHCESTGNSPGAPGYGPSVGEVGLMRVFLVRDTVVKAIHAWRGALFFVDDVTTWPVTGEEVNRTIELFASMTASPAASQ